MDLGALQTSLTTWVGSLSGLPVEWGKQPIVIHTQPFVLAYPGPVLPVGHDEPKYVTNQQTGELEETMVGVRRFNLRLSFRSFSQRMGQSARQHAENFRILTRGSGSRNALYDAQIGLWGTEVLNDTDYVWNGRLISQVDMNVILGVPAQVLHKALEEVGNIENVYIEAQSYVIDEQVMPVEDEDGVPLGRKEFDIEVES